jgi:hypothetical protein
MMMIVTECVAQMQKYLSTLVESIHEFNTNSERARDVTLFGIA